MLNKFFFVIVFLLLFMSCEKNPQPINYYNEDCANCQMTISDNKYGTELITQKGKTYKFDSIECLISYMNNFNKEEIHSLWVTDFSKPGNLINAEKAFYLKSDKLQSPMGLNVSAFENMNELNEVKQKHDGIILKWNELLKFAKHEMH
ncbi:MAG: nitrous oxide reductase accessory protein NosL [Melioribacter sp.]|uniref:nitrous oxide reductase accessory protein NosL n=1 Tax=Rosettibacter primus TaxID=3111523 RepID=UPI00247C33DA|nr:nitrous oxide reductase accessory protein NosL [Melioribacter sp.]